MSTREILSICSAIIATAEKFKKTLTSSAALKMQPAEDHMKSCTAYPKQHSITTVTHTPLNTM